MSLGRKIVTLFFVLGFSISLGSFVVLKLTVLPAFDEFERESKQATLLRVRQALDADLDALKRMSSSLAVSDQLRAMVSGDPAQATSEWLTPGHWPAPDVHLLMALTADGQQLFSTLRESASGDLIDVNPLFGAPLNPDHPLVSQEFPSHSVAGLIETTAGILQVVSVPIRPDAGSGPAGGRLVAGRFLTPERISTMGERTTARLSLSAPDDAASPLTVQDQRRQALRSVQSRTDRNTTSERIRLNDLFGRTIATLHIESPVRVAEIVSEVTRTVTLLMFVLSAIFLLSASLFMRRLIVTPLQQLTRQILDIRKTGDLHFEADRTRGDEVGVLAGEFEAMTSELRKGRRRLERARDEAVAISRAKSEFLARMSHEIRTPMNGVLGMTELLRNTQLEVKQRRFADAIYDSAETLLNIINDILDFSKIEAGKMRLDLVDVHLRTVVEETVQGLASQAHNRNVELMTMVPPGLNALVKTDPVRLRQVLTNLVSNAVKFTENGEVVVKLSAAQHEAGYQNVRFEVCDTGIGIRKDQQCEIFESFTQADGSTTRLYGGTGLGLTICKQLIEQMGGELRLHSTPDEGSVFWFELNLQTSHAVASRACVQMQCVAGRRVLIVDDNATNREILEHQLSSWRAHADSVSCAQEAYLELVQALDSGAPYDLVILDMNMPQATGLDLARSIRANDDLEPLRLLILSSVATPACEEALMELNIAGQLSKPVRQAQLYDALMLVMGDQVITPHSSELATAIARRLKGRVLVVEDNAVNRLVAKSMLDALGLDVVLAKNGMEAVEAFESDSFDLVLMDCQLPVMDGYRATQLIRQIEARSDRVRTPIIAATANVLQSDKDNCLAAGMDDFLTKPFTSEQLHAVLALYLPMPASSVEPPGAPVNGGDSVVRPNVFDTVIDQATLGRLSKLQQPGAPNIVRKLLGLYLQSSAVIKDRLGNALDASNAPVIRESAHALKSSSLNVGAVELANLCKRLEAMARDNAVDDGPAFRRILDSEYAKVVDALQFELQEKTA